MIGIDSSGSLYWSRFAAQGTDRQAHTASISDPDQFVAACLVAPGLVVAAAGRNQLIRLRAVGAKLRPVGAALELTLPARVVFLASRPGNGVVAVLADGSLLRLPSLP